MSTLHISLPRVSTSPARARREIGRFATDNQVDDADTILLLASELVTNAVLHGAEPIDLRVICDDSCVRIEVSDSNPDAEAVVTRERTPNRPGGWGLQIVERVTSHWGAVRHAGGKTVWVELDRPLGSGAIPH